MMKPSPVALAAAIVAASTFAGCRSTTASCPNNVDNSPARKQRIIENLSAKYEALGPLNPSLGDIQRGPGCIDAVTMTVHSPRGEQSQTLLVSPNDQALYIVLEGPIDVSKTAAELSAAKAQQQQRSAKDLAAATQDRPVRGNPQAPLTIVAFSDFQCPYCSRGAEIMEQVREKYPDKVKVVFMDFPLGFHEWAKPAAVAAQCAASQSPQAFWTLHDKLFADQEGITSDNLVEKSEGFLGGTGIDLTEWQKCATDDSSDAHKQAVARVDAAMEAGRKLGVDGTPAFFIGGELYSGALPLEQFEQAVQKALAGKS